MLLAHLRLLDLDHVPDRRSGSLGRLYRPKQAFVLGATVEALERDVAEFVGVDHAIGCASGTDALILSLMAAGIGPGDRVIALLESSVELTHQLDPPPTGRLAAIGGAQLACGDLGLPTIW